MSIRDVVGCGRDGHDVQVKIDRLSEVFPRVHGRIGADLDSQILVIAIIWLISLRHAVAFERLDILLIASGRPWAGAVASLLSLRHKTWHTLLQIINTR